MIYGSLFIWAWFILLPDVFVSDSRLQTWSAFPPSFGESLLKHFYGFWSAAPLSEWVIDQSEQHCTSLYNLSSQRNVPFYKALLKLTVRCFMCLIAKRKLLEETAHLLLGDRNLCLINPCIESRVSSVHCTNEWSVSLASQVIRCLTLWRANLLWSK